MTRSKLCTKKVYTDKASGEEKVVWLEIGTMITKDDGKSFIELNMHPNTTVYVFEDKPRQPSNSAPRQQVEPKGIDLDSGGVNVEDIPF